ncbi:DNA-processing protein DprA [Desulfotalea psychrophila]|uniref:DNA-processing protein DprA n=1 Tax=Desulfotalea psychrophila TaxID=84980 RepID=UPI001389F007|nr:DNA-processing protein DprA [Desulfotalea psychrophila]
MRGFWRLIEFYHHPSRVLDASLAQIRSVAGLREGQLAGFADPQSLRLSAAEELGRLDALGLLAISFSSPLYPENLKQIFDPPPVLYASGDLSLLNTHALAIVGARASTSYGRRVAHNLSSAVSLAGLTVVSGLALGVDTAAHEGALAVSGKTIAVLGCGLDIVYPYQNKKLYKIIAGEGLVITEYPLGTRPDGFRFPARNRIIAGMSDGVLVVEAARKSGSLITAQLALDFNREVFAVPGQIDSVKSAGTHILLQQGAKLVHDVTDILEEFPFPLRVGQGGQKGEASLPSEAGQQILDLLDVYPSSQEELMVESKLSAKKVAEELLLLELEDLIEILPGNMVRRV